jgi:3-hydroxyacyl-[acyl-carrier-protein] dehydratase
MRWMWIDRIVELEPGRRLVAVKNVSLAEEHLHDHFEAEGSEAALPVMPASLILEGMAQSAGILVGHAGGFKEKVILAKVGKAEFARDAGPGSVLRYTATAERVDPLGAATVCVGEIMPHAGAGGWEPMGRAEIMFSHVDKNMAGLEFPEHNFVFGEAFQTLLRLSGVAFPSGV